MSDRDRPTGKHLRITDPSAPVDGPRTAGGARTTTEYWASPDLELLPRRFEVFAGEVREFMSTVRGQVVPALARVEERIASQESWSYDQTVRINSRIDSVDKKLDEISALLRSIVKQGRDPAERTGRISLVEINTEAEKDKP